MTEIERRVIEAGNRLAADATSEEKMLAILIATFQGLAHNFVEAGKLLKRNIEVSCFAILPEECRKFGIDPEAEEE